MNNITTVVRVDPLTGESNALTLPITEKQLEMYEEGHLSLDEAFPNLKPYEREFIKSGLTQESWDALHGVDNNVFCISGDINGSTDSSED